MTDHHDDLPVDDLTRKTLEIEDRPDPSSVEDPDAIDRLLNTDSEEPRA